MRFALSVLAALTLANAAAATPVSAAAKPQPLKIAPAVLVDGFEDTGLWKPAPADGVTEKVTGEPGVHGSALRIDFKFTGGGYAIVRRELPLDLPGNYEFSFMIRGDAPVENLEFKLIDASGENVWWCNRRDTEFPREWRRFTIKKRQISFAWGPQGGGEIAHVAAIEFAITAGSGGSGTVWLDDLISRQLPPAGTTPLPPIATASSSARGHGAARVFDGRPNSYWSPAEGDKEPWLELDLRGTRELGGLVIDWTPKAYSPAYDVEASDDGRTWQTLQSVRDGNGGRDYIALPETETAYLRLRFLLMIATSVTGLVGHGETTYEPGVERILIEPLSFSDTREAFFGAIAADRAPGLYPRGISGEQPYWTILGADGSGGPALLGEDGALETGPGRFSIEPFLQLGEQLLTWASVETSQSLGSGGVPIPTVTWRSGAPRLDVTAFTAGDPDSGLIVARYRVANTGASPLRPTLFLAVRPFQVNPPAQFLGKHGGCAPIHEIAIAERVVAVDRRPAFACLNPPAITAAKTFFGGDVIADWLGAGRMPAPDRGAQDGFGAASALLGWPLTLDAGAETEIAIVLPSDRRGDLPAPVLGRRLESALQRSPEAARAWVASEERRAGNDWLRKTGGVRISLPRSAKIIEESIRAQLGYILVTRVGPALQPGARSYGRSWIRDGSLMSSALLRLGLPEPAREFADWFAPFQYPSGKIPCVVDSRGADPVPEHDSGGEFIFLVAELWRYTGDRDLVARLWPHVRAAAAYLDSLRLTERTAAYRAPDKIEFYGLLPPSISHEGYSAKPMHSYWDDFFALRGFRDAARLADALGNETERARWIAVADTFAADLNASVAASMRKHGIDYVPGCADLGDFDATSTAIALDPTGAAAILAREAVDRTFDKYWENFRARRAGGEWKDYTPYEMRVIGAMVRLGQRERAGEMLDWFLGAQVPPGWRQWPEVVTSSPRVPHFLGDLPHTWVGAEFLRSMVDMFAYVDEARDALVVGAGIQPAWVDEDQGLAIKGLPTPWGKLDLTMRRDMESLTATVGGDLRVPPGGIVLRPPLRGPVRAIALDGKPQPPPGGEFVLHKIPATVAVRW